MFTRYKEECYILIKWSIQQEDITITNIYSPNKLSKIYKAKVDRIKGRNRQFTIIVGEFHTPLSVMDRTATQKTSKEIENLNNSIK